MITQKSINSCIDVARSFGASRLVLFGSAVSDAFSARDIDLICTGVSGFDFFRMADRMEREAGVPIDVFPDDDGVFSRYNVARGKILYEC